mmetsp:Transcript_80330/g.227426  ORF Transcript_80330/g.227426 Transcript_80330/m.227426 type:complete len:203 (-) Transcript_80330:678-1286(-)
MHLIEPQALAAGLAERLEDPAEQLLRPLRPQRDAGRGELGKADGAHAIHVHGGRDSPGFVLVQMQNLGQLVGQLLVRDLSLEAPVDAPEGLGDSRKLADRHVVLAEVVCRHALILALLGELEQRCRNRLPPLPQHLSACQELRTWASFGRATHGPAAVCPGSTLPPTLCVLEQPVVAHALNCRGPLLGVQRQHATHQVCNAL